MTTSTTRRSTTRTTPRSAARRTQGLGRFGGEWAIDEFTTDHWVSVQHTKRQFPF